MNSTLHIAQLATKAPSDKDEPDFKVLLLAQAHKLGIRGANSRWSIKTLMDKTTATLRAKSESLDEERTRLIADIRARRLPGYNLADRWTLSTLRAEAAQS